MIAALYVQADGAYFGLDGVDPWDETRDARTYDGPHRVIAHPPCNVWCGFARLNEKRYGIKVGDDGGCFAHALATVQRVGGVLEHPAYSLAWAPHGLTRPVKGCWTRCGSHPDAWVCQVAQSAYGHPARKRTWLYYVGPEPSELRWEEPDGTHQVGWFDRKRPTLSKREGKRTPEAFRAVLLSLARL